MAPAADDGSLGAEVEGPDGDAPSRPRRRRGGRGRGRGRDGREGGPRESRPDLEARGEEPNLAFDADEDSNPSIPTPPQAAAAYAQTVERMSHTDAPVFWEVPALAAPPAAPVERGGTPETPPSLTAAKPAPPVAPVDPSKASFSLLGWLKGGG